jgi:hypothetical protein
MVEFAVATRDQAPYRTEDIQLGRGESHKGPGEVRFGVALIIIFFPNQITKTTS